MRQNDLRSVRIRRKRRSNTRLFALLGCVLILALAYGAYTSLSPSNEESTAPAPAISSAPAPADTSAQVSPAAAAHLCCRGKAACRAAVPAGQKDTRRNEHPYQEERVPSLSPRRRRRRKLMADCARQERGTEARERRHEDPQRQLPHRRGA